mgnify:CR=1 FL=1
MKNSINSFEKSPKKSIKYSTYFNSYDHFFKNYIGKKITFVEIGVLSGGSLFMWRDYFGEKARIIGIDNNPNALKWKNYGFEIYIGDQEDFLFWENFKKSVGKVDVILDDGGHTYDQQIITVECLLDNVSDNGVIVIEDTHTSYMDNYGTKKYSFINYVKNKIDQVNFRFHLFENKPEVERRFWSIEVTESMVAFKINIKESNKKSLLLNNGGEDDYAEDFTYKGDIVTNAITSFSNKFNLLS